jgi:predicted TIM-barrel fold metal-dependent hydrolase
MTVLPPLFDVNASFGKPSSENSDFPSLRDRLSTMDRLGISRALVWNVESVQNHALSSNEKLLEEIRNTPGAAGRIFPALSASGLMTYEREGLASLKRQMKAVPCRALRFNNAFGRLTLMQLAPVIKSICTLKPFIILAQDQASVADILEFAETFPDVPLVLTNVIWGPCITVFDLMRRRRSILMDTSWFHTFEAIELAVKHFGADRLVFGTGLKSHNGAAIGALARADITVTQRRKIAYGNLDRLTGLKSGGMKPLSCGKANTLWPLFLEGKPLGVDVVDAHGHLGPSAGYVLEAQEERQQLQAGLKAMEKIGIQTFIVSGLQALMGGPVEGNDLLQNVLRPNSDRVLGYLAFNPFYASELTPKFDAYFRGPVYKGFKTLCDYWHVAITDERFEPMWAYADRHRLPVLSHTWEGPFNSPAMFKDLVKRYPNVSFLLAHSGGGDKGRREAEALAQKHSNVYLEWCGSFCSSVLWEDTLQRVNPRQVVFGTDAMAHGFAWELARLLSLEVPDSVLTQILGGNMRRILARRRSR